MLIHQRLSNPVSNTLRARKADFFRMQVFGTVGHAPARDNFPLRRPLNRQLAPGIADTNENMCFALWELMARS